MNNYFENKTVLVTGGTGSIGSVIVRELLQRGASQVRVYSRDETRQFELAHAIGHDPRISFLIGDVRDKERLQLAMENVDIVFHAAALKHVASCEKNPFEAVKTNVLGTQNVIDCAFAAKVDRVIGISTDKATDPSNVMGCTKLLAEKIMLASFFYKGNKKTKFCFVRFGNVIGSRGSVIPLFINQVKAGGPITVTDPKMTRFLMSIPQAVQLVLKAAHLMQDREIFILKMPVATVGDIAQAVSEVVREQNPELPAVDISVVGKHDGERIHEKLLTEEEAAQALENDEMFIVMPNFSLEYESYQRPEYDGAALTQHREYASNKVPALSVEELKDMLREDMELTL